MANNLFVVERQSWKLVYGKPFGFGGIVATTDAFNIDHGKLTLNAIRVTDKDGSPLVMYDPDRKELVDMRPESERSTVQP